MATDKNGRRIQAVQVVQPTPQLRIRMDMLVTAVKNDLKLHSKVDDADSAHLNTCHRIADEYDLWDQDMFPTWLSIIVQYEGREMGLLQ